MASVPHIAFGVPFSPTPGSSSGAFNTFALDGSADMAAWLFTAPEDMTVTQLGFNYASRTGTPPTYRISLQALNTSGNPDGTVLGGGSPASATFTPPADTTWNNTFRWITLTNSIAIQGGTEYAIVIDYSSGTVDASNFSTINTGHQNLGPRCQFPVASHFAGASWSKQSPAPVYGYRTASRSYGTPMQTFFTSTFSQDTTSGNGGDERGMKFNLPAGWGDTYKIRGIGWIGAGPATARGFTVRLYSGTTVLQDKTYDSDVVQGTGAYQKFEALFDEDSLTALSFGSDYFVTVGADNTSLNIAVYGIEVAEAQDRICFGLGLNSQWAFRTDSTGALDETITTRVPMMWLIPDDWTELAGGGGGLLTHPGMAGGCRG